MVEMTDLVKDFAAAFKAVDKAIPIGRSKTREYKPGIGPLTENEAVTKAVAWLRSAKSGAYSEARPMPYPKSRQVCDMVLPGEWAIELKLIRPFGDNGIEAEHWSENVLHPYPGNISAIGDALKLTNSGFQERLGIVVFGYEHKPARINLDVAISCFEVMCGQVLGIELTQRHSAEFSDLIHPSHQHGKVFGWEVIRHKPI